MPYSLVARAVEPGFVPMAQALGIGLTAWSPVGGGRRLDETGAPELGAPCSMFTPEYQ